jgi:N-terminal C2 in EEIG1 and EHBP1 proteins
MKRSSSKLITRARSMRNLAKVPFKFKFDLLIETVDKLAASGDICVVWERNQKVDGTKPAKIDRTTRKATFNNEKISSDITLFKTSPSERKFQDKVIKIAVRTGNLEGKTLGKIHINLADYAEVPSGSKRIAAELSSGATLVATIQCTFQSMGKASTKGDKKGEGADLDGDDDDDDDDDDYGDADTADGEDSPSSYIKNKFSQNLKRAASKKTISTKERAGNDETSTASVCGGAAVDVEKLRKENIRLRKQVDELEKSSGGGSGAGESKANEENKALRREVNDLRSALAREPVYSDVVKELKEAKMALALINLEKEEITLELMKQRRGEGSPMSQSSA